MDLNLSQFRTLLFIHAAQCDYEYHPREQAFIEKQCSKSEYSEMLKLYQSNKTASFSYLIKEYNKRFPDQNSRNSIKIELMKLFHIDKKFCEFEKKFLMFFSNLKLKY